MMDPQPEDRRRSDKAEARKALEEALDEHVDAIWTLRLLTNGEDVYRSDGELYGAWTGYKFWEWGAEMEELHERYVM